MATTTVTTRAVKITDVLQGQPPALLTSELVIGPAGKPRLFTQKIQVRDQELWHHLNAEVQKGDTVQLTIKTVWPDEGRYYTCLESYARLETSTGVAELAEASH